MGYAIRLRSINSVNDPQDEFKNRALAREGMKLEL